MNNVNTPKSFIVIDYLIAVETMKLYIYAEVAYKQSNKPNHFRISNNKLLLIAWTHSFLFHDNTYQLL